jgi:predicted nucleic acid-binding protein
MKAIIDTNVIVDAIAARVPFNIEAEKIILLAADKQIVAAITASTASDIYYITQKYLKDKVLTKAHLQTLFTLVEIVAVDGVDCVSAFDTGINDYEDSLLAVCAKKWDADYIISRNTTDFTTSPVPAISPEAFLKFLSRV